MKLQSFQPLPSWSINLLKEKQNGKRGSSPRVYKLQNSAIMISCFMIVSFFLNFVACTRIALEQICFQQGKLTVDCGQMNYRSILLVCPWRHGGHVGGQEQKHFSPLGSKLYFHVNSSRKYSFVLTETWPLCHVVANQEYLRPPWMDLISVQCLGALFVWPCFELRPTKLRREQCRPFLDFLIRILQSLVNSFL